MWRTSSFSVGLLPRSRRFDPSIELRLAMASAERSPPGFRKFSLRLLPASANHRDHGLLTFASSRRQIALRNLRIWITGIGRVTPTNLSAYFQSSRTLV